MTHSDAKLTPHRLVLAAALATALLSGPATAAPDTIMLEAIGAVRMAGPGEYQRVRPDERLTGNRSRDDRPPERAANAR